MESGFPMSCIIVNNNGPESKMRDLKTLFMGLDLNKTSGKIIKKPRGKLKGVI